MKLFERSTVDAVFEHPHHGLVYITQGYGPAGLRWEHGLAVKIPSTLTLDALKAAVWCEGMSYYDAVRAGYYGKPLNLDLERVATELGLTRQADKILDNA